MSGPGIYFRAQTAEEAAVHIFDKSEMSGPGAHFRAQTAEGGEDGEEKKRKKKRTKEKTYSWMFKATISPKYFLIY